MSDTDPAIFADRKPSDPTGSDFLLGRQVGIARGIAFAAHYDQFRRDGLTAYITHPDRIARAARALGVRHECAAWLHDVLEDSDLTPQLLLDAGISETVVAAVQLLTRNPDENYAFFIERIIADHQGLGHTVPQKVAATIKVLDILDNLESNPKPDKVSTYTTAIRLLIEAFPHLLTDLVRCNSFERLEAARVPFTSKPAA